MYIPERNIDDPNYPGVTESIPKVAHIEFRYKDNSIVEHNLDDNNCFRVYFTNYNTNTKLRAVTEGVKLGTMTYEHDFEKDREALRELYPIMRNHIYQFYMKSGSPVSEFDVKVTDWGGTPVTYVDW